MSSSSSSPAGLEIISAAVLLIGDELLSGRTPDANLSWIATYLNRLGIQVAEARVVPDDATAIAEAVNALRRRYAYVFTTGGIGPTHDDITADAIAQAFGVGIGEHPEAARRLKAQYAAMGREITLARMRMARVPEGAELIDNAVSIAPGFRLENVFVMAGVPAVMQAMLDHAGAGLRRGRPMLSRTLQVSVSEGDLAVPLGRMQEAHPAVSIGSYPFFRAGADRMRFGVNVVLRAVDKATLDAAVDQTARMLQDLSLSGGTGTSE